MLGVLLVLGGVVGAPGASAAPDDVEALSQTKIIGGKAVANDAYPFMASLQFSGRSFCGASLVAPRVVMTAAHCVTSQDELTGLPVPNTAGVSVVVGRTALSNMNQGVERGVLSLLGKDLVVIHPRYLQGDAAYDVAFVYLDRSVSGIVPVKLPTKGTDALLRPGQKATVIGWGNTDTELSNFPDRLRQVQVPILSQDECKISYDSFNPDVNFCAGVQGKDSCQGDSGGPIFRQIPGRDTAYQTGVVSYGAGCGDQGAPGVYVSLSSAKLWDTLAESRDGQRIKNSLNR
ncbi:serine protease [Acaricomes phytoseiuli]|uniref:S1 family peptidase n=1 Tax=Acaricomes phytoseiuli TaxID=291968 RepID=UPI002221D393|nr:serine protease [Acaricomes phytoseiuli]MCW1249202.1 serine protease [Acaricomes phytoseiuli]